MEKTGKVVSDKMDKTITVRVERLVPHPRYKKYVRKISKFYAHDEKEEARVGDTVKIVETRPISKKKRWKLKKVIRKKEGE